MIGGFNWRDVLICVFLLSSHARVGSEVSGSSTGSIRGWVYFVGGALFSRTRPPPAR